MATKVEIKPTARLGEDLQFSDIALTGLFNAHIAILNSERQVLWVRYQAMLIANSILFAYLARASSPGFWEVLVSCLCGWILCASWLIMTVSGFRLFFILHDATLGFTWENLSANPSQTGDDYRKKDWIKRTAYFVILLFAVVYLLLAVRGWVS